MVKNLPAVQETQVQSLDLEDALEKGTATHSSILARSLVSGAWWATVHAVEKSGTQQRDKHFPVLSRFLLFPFTLLPLFCICPSLFLSLNLR